MSGRPIVAVLIPDPTRTQIFGSAIPARLAEVADVRLVDGSPDAWDLGTVLKGATVALTGWGTPSLMGPLSTGLPTLGLVAHTAGSVRRLLPEGVIGRTVRVSHAAAIIADAVAEFVVLEALHNLRGLAALDRDMKRGRRWRGMGEQRSMRLLGARTVGVIGAGRVGRAVVHLFRAFGSRVLLTDPVLTEQAISDLGAEPSDMPSLLQQSDIVSLHAPVLPGTRDMIGARELSLMRDGTLLINTARAALINESALRAELSTGRIKAALDVFWQEPLPQDDELRRLPNVVLSPHSAGHTIDTWVRQGEAMVDDIVRYARGEPLVYEVTEDMVAVMA